MDFKEFGIYISVKGSFTIKNLINLEFRKSLALGYF